MAHAKGSQALLTMGRETTFGTAATGNFLQLPIISTDLGISQDLIRSQALQGSRHRTEPVLNEKSGQGAIVMQADVRSIGFILSELLALPTTTGINPYTHVFKPGTTLPTGVTFEKWFSDISIALQYIGGKIGGLSFEVTSGGLLQVTAQVQCADEANSGRIDSAPYKYNIIPFRMPSVTLTEGGSATTKATRFSLEFDNELEPIRTVGNSGKVQNILEGWASVRGSLEVIFEDMTMYNKAKNATESSLKVKFPSVTDAAHYLEFEMQEVRYAVASPPIQGPGGIMCSLDWEAFYDNGAGASSFIVTLVNDVTVYTSIPA